MMVSLELQAESSSSELVTTSSSGLADEAIRSEQLDEVVPWEPGCSSGEEHRKINTYRLPVFHHLKV